VTWEFEQVSGNVHRLFFELSNSDERQRVLWISDLHWDNPHCDLKLLTKHLNQAREYHAPVVIVGDFFCAMQGKYDKRASKDCIRPEHQHGDYLDKLVTTAVDWFEPWKDLICVIGYGNHETSIKRKHETDLIERFCQSSRDRGGIVRPGGYNGWVSHRLRSHNTRARFDFFYAHGSGGGAPVTKGAINFNRWREQVDSDAIIAGHIHRRNVNDQVVATINNANRVVHRQLDYVRLSTYKDEYGDGAHGWHNEGQMGPRPLGGYWCEWRSDRQRRTFSRVWIPTD
jgi:hypothetical protein